MKRMKRMKQGGGNRRRSPIKRFLRRRRKHHGLRIGTAAVPDVHDGSLRKTDVGSAVGVQLPGSYYTRRTGPRQA